MERLKRNEIVDCEDGEWYPQPCRGDSISCCRCGMTHDVGFKIVVKNGKRFIKVKYAYNARKTARYGRRMPDGAKP